MWKGPGEDPGGPESGGSKGGASQQELQDLKDQYEQQQTLIAQLKEMLRKTDQPTINQEKVAEYANTLTKMNARAKRGQREGQPSSRLRETPKTERVMLLRQQMEQNKAKMAERGKNQRGMEEMVTQIRAQLDDSQHNLTLTQTPLNISLIDDRVDYTPNTNPQELYNILLNKDKRINELNGKITRLEANVIDLQENIKEKDSVIDARTKAITLMTENLTKKGKNTLDTLDETKEQMRKMQEDFVRMEEEMKAENEKLKLELEEKENINKVLRLDLEEKENVIKYLRLETNTDETDGSVLNQLKQRICELEELNSTNKNADLEDLNKKNQEYINELEELKKKNQEYINELEESKSRILELESTLNDDLVQQLHKRIAELEDSMSNESPQSTSKNKRSKKGKQQKQSDNVTTKISELEIIIQERDLQIKELEIKAQSTTAEMNGFKQTIDDLKKEISDKQVVIEKLQGELKKTREELMEKQTELQKTIDELQKTINEQLEKLKSFESVEIGDENPAVVKLRQQLDESNKSMIKAKAQHKSKVKELNKKIDQFKKIGDLNAAVVRLEAENSKYTQRIAELEEEKGQLQLNMVESKESINLDEVKDLEDRLREYLEEIAEKNSRIATLEHTNEENETKITELTEKLDELTNTQNAQIKSDLTSVQYEEQLEKLESEKKLMLTEKDELISENKNLLEKIEIMRKEKQEISNKLDNYMQENIELMDRLEKLSAEKVSSAESIEIVENLTQQEKMELEAYQNNKSSENVELNESVTQLNEETSELLQKIELFTVERREVMEKMEALTAENNQLSLKLKEVENNRDVLVETYEQLQTEKEELDLKLEKLDNKESNMEWKKLIEEQRKEIEVLKDEINSVDEYKSLIEIQKQEIQELRLKVLSGESKTHTANLIEELQLKNGEYEIRNLELEKRMGDFEDKLKQSVVDIEAYKSAIEGGKDELIASTNLIEDLREKLKQKSLEVEHYENEVNKLGAMIEELSVLNETKADANIEELQILKSSLSENLKIIEDYEVELNQNSTTISQLNAEMKKLNDRIVQTEYLLHEKDVEIDKINQEKLVLEENNRLLENTMKDKENNFRTSCEELKERCLRLQKQVENNTDSFAPLGVKIQDLEKKNKEQLEKMKKIVVNLRKKTADYKELEVKHQQLETASQDLKNRCLNLEILNRDLEATSQDLKTKCQDLQVKCRDLEVNSQNLRSEHCNEQSPDLSDKYQQLELTNQDLEVKYKNLEVTHRDLEVACSNFEAMMQDLELEKRKLDEELKLALDGKKEMEEKLSAEAKEMEKMRNDLQLKAKMVRKLQAKVKEEKQKAAHAQTDEEKLKKRDVEKESSENLDSERKKIDTEQQKNIDCWEETSEKVFTETSEEETIVEMQEKLRKNLRTIEELKSELETKDELINQLKGDVVESTEELEKQKSSTEEKSEGLRKTGSLKKQKKRGKTTDEYQGSNLQSSEDNFKKDKDGEDNLDKREKDLEEKQKDLEASKKKLEERENDLSEKAKYLEEELKNLEEKRENTITLESSDNTRVSEENLQQLQNVQKEIQDKNTLIKKLKVKVKTSGQEIQNLRSQIEESEHKNIELTQNNLTNTAQIEDLQNIIREYENQTARLTGELENLRFDANNTSNLELSRKDDIINELNGRLEAKEINSEALRMKINELEMYIESQVSELVKLKEKNEKLEEGLSNVEERRKSLENRTFILGKELKEKEENARNEDLLEERLKIIAERDQAIENSLKETLEENQNLIRENQKLSNELEVIKNQLDLAEKKLLTLNEETARVELLENENSELQRNVNNVESELRKITQELNYLKEQREKSETELQEQLEQYNSERRDLMGRLELALEEVKELTQGRNDLRFENGDLVSKLDQQQLDFEEQLRRYQDLEVEYRGKMEVLERISQRCEELEGKVTQLEKEDIPHQQIQQKSISAQQNTQIENFDDPNLQQLPNTMEELTDKLKTMQFMLFNAEKERDSALQQCNQLSAQLAQLVYEKLESQITVDQEESSVQHKNLEEVGSERPTVKVKRSELSTFSSRDAIIEEPMVIAKKTFVCYKGEDASDNKKDIFGENDDIFGESEGWGGETTEVIDEVKVNDSVRILEEKIRVLELERENHAEQLKQAQIKSAKLIKRLKEYKLKNEQLMAKTKNDDFSDLNDAIVEELKSQVACLEKRAREINLELEKEKLEKENLLKRIDVLTSANERMIDMKEKQDVELLAWQQRNRDLNLKLEQMEWGDERVVAEVKEKVTADNQQELLDTIKELTLDNEELQTMLEEQRNLRLEAEKSKQALPENVKSVVEYNQIVLEKNSLEEKLKEKERLIEELVMESKRMREEPKNSESQAQLERVQREHQAMQEKLRETTQQLQANYSEKTQLEATILENNITIDALNQQIVVISRDQENQFFQSQSLENQFFQGQSSENQLGALEEELEASVLKINSLQDDLRKAKAEKEEVEVTLCQYQVERSIREESVRIEKEQLAFERQILDKEELVGLVEKYKIENQKLVETLEQMRAEISALKTQGIDVQEQRGIAFESISQEANIDFQGFTVHQTEHQSGLSQFFGSEAQSQFVIEPSKEASYVDDLKLQNERMASSLKQLKHELEDVKRENARLEELRLKKEPEQRKSGGIFSQFFQDDATSHAFDLPLQTDNSRELQLQKNEIESSLEQLRQEKNEIVSSLEQLKPERSEILAYLKQLNQEKNEIVSSLEALRLERSEIQSSLDQARLEKEHLLEELKGLEAENTKLEKNSTNQKTKTEDVSRFFADDSHQQPFISETMLSAKHFEESNPSNLQSPQELEQLKLQNEELLAKIQELRNENLFLEQLNPERVAVQQLQYQNMELLTGVRELQDAKVALEQEKIESDAVSRKLSESMVDKSSTADLFNQQICANLQESSSNMTEFFDKQKGNDSEQLGFFNQASSTADFFNQTPLEKTAADFFNQQEVFASNLQAETLQREALFDVQPNESVFEDMQQKQIPIFGAKKEEDVTASHSLLELKNIEKEKVALIQRLEADNLELQQKCQILENSLVAKESEMGAAIQQLNQEWSVHVDQRGCDVAESWKLHLESRESEFAQIEQQLRKDIQELEQKCTVLSQENGDLRRNVDEEVKQELDKIAVLRKLVEEKESEIVELKSKYEEFEQMQVDISNYTRIISELNMKIQELEGKEIKLLEEKREIIATRDRDKESEQLRLQNEDLIASVQKEKQVSAQLKLQNEDLVASLQELHKEKSALDQLKLQNEELVAFTNNEKSALEQLKLQNEQLVASVQELQNDLEHLRFKNKELATSVEELQQEKLTLERVKLQNEELFTSMHNKSDLETLKLKIDSLENEKVFLERLNPEQIDVNELKLQNEELAASLRELRKQTIPDDAVEEKDRLINKLRVDFKEKENDLQETRLYLEDLRNQHAQMSFQIANMQGVLSEKDLKIQELQIGVNQLEQQLGDYAQQANHYSVQLQENYLHSENLRQELEGYKSVTAHVQDKDAEIVRVKNLLEEKQREFSYEIERTTLELQSVISDQQQELEVTRRKLQDLEVVYAELFNTNKTVEEFYKKQIEDLQQNLQIELQNRDQTEKILELEEIIRDDEKQLLDLKNIIEEQVLKIEELKQELYAKSNNYDALVAQLDLKNIPKPTSSLVSTSEVQDEDLVEPVSRAKLDFALYMLHQRDVRCEELTMELMQLLEERDTLQLRLSNALREKEQLRSAAEKSEEEVVRKSVVAVSGGAVPNSKAIILGATGTELAAEATENLKAAADGSLANKLSELKSVGYKKDKTIVDEQALRRIQQLSILQEHQDELAKLPPEAAARLVDASYTLSRDVQSPSKVLLNWLWGTSTPKVNNV